MADEFSNHSDVQTSRMSVQDSYGNKVEFTKEENSRGAFTTSGTLHCKGIEGETSISPEEAAQLIKQLNPGGFAVSDAKPGTLQPLNVACEAMKKGKSR